MSKHWRNGQAMSLDDPRVVARDESGQVFDPRDDPHQSYGRYGQRMTVRPDQHCIERRGIGGGKQFYSIRAYEDDLARGSRLRGPRAKSFHGVIWTLDAPRQEQLTEEWIKTTEGSFRSADPISTTSRCGS